MQRTSIATLAALAVLVSVLAVSAAVPAAGTLDTGSGQNATQADYSLTDLQNNGKIIDERYPSLRVAGEMTAFWTVAYPPSGFNTYGGDDAQKEYLTADTTVRRNKIRLFASHPFDGEQRTYNLTLVYWHADTRETHTENGTTTERYANITAVDEQQITLDSGMRRHADIHLRGHYDRPSRVTIFLDEYDLQWTFKHKSVATAQPVNIDSRSDLYDWALKWMVLPALIVSAVVGKGVPALRRRAGAGTGYPAGLWILLGSIAGLVVYTGGYVAYASLIAALPLVFPLLVGMVQGAIQLEDDGDAVEEWGFIRLSDIEKVGSPIDDKAEILDSGEIEVKGFDIVYTSDGEPALYHKGILPMLARYWGKYAKVNIPNQEAEWNAVGDYDKVVIVDNESEDILDHKRERVVFKWPWRTYNADDYDADEIDPALAAIYPRELGKPQYIQMALLAGVLGGAAFASHLHLGHWLWGLTAAAVPAGLYYATPINGYAQTYVASGQATAAWTTAWYLNFTMKRFGTIEQVVAALIESENRKYDPMEWIREAKEEGVISSAHDEATPFETNLIDDDPATTHAGADD